MAHPPPARSEPFTSSSEAAGPAGAAAVGAATAAAAPPTEGALLAARAAVAVPSPAPPRPPRPVALPTTGSFRPHTAANASGLGLDISEAELKSYVTANMEAVAVCAARLTIRQYRKILVGMSHEFGDRVALDRFTVGDAVSYAAIANQRRRAKQELQGLPPSVLRQMAAAALRAAEAAEAEAPAPALAPVAPTAPAAPGDPASRAAAAAAPDAPALPAAASGHAHAAPARAPAPAAPAVTGALATLAAAAAAAVEAGGDEATREAVSPAMPPQTGSSSAFGLFGPPELKRARSIQGEEEEEEDQ